MFVADTFGVSAPPFPVSASNNDPNMRTELLLPPVLRRRRGKILREEEEDKETLPTRATSRATAALRDDETTVLEHAEATRMYYLLSVVCASVLTYT